METVTYFHIKEGILLATGDMVYETVGTDTSEELAKQKYRELVRKYPNNKLFLIEIREKVVLRSDK